MKALTRLTHAGSLSNLQTLLSDQEGVHEASAELRVEGLLQACEHGKVLFFEEAVHLVNLSPDVQPFEQPRVKVIDLQTIVFKYRHILKQTAQIQDVAPGSTGSPSVRFSCWFDPPWS